MRKFFITGASFALSGIVIIFLLYNGLIRFNYPNKNDFPIRGIDISHHQGNILWDELKTEDISFIIIKATEGLFQMIRMTFRQQLISNSVKIVKATSHGN